MVKGRYVVQDVSVIQTYSHSNLCGCHERTFSLTRSPPLILTISKFPQSLLSLHLMYIAIKHAGIKWEVSVEPGGVPVCFATECEAMLYAFGGTSISSASLRREAHELSSLPPGRRKRSNR